jgi:hypothetical protein
MAGASDHIARNYKQSCILYFVFYQFSIEISPTEMGNFQFEKCERNLLAGLT